MPKLPVTSGGPAAPDILPPDILLRRATQAEQDGRRDEAVELYRRVLMLEPNNIEAINQLGVAAGERGDLSAAVRRFQHSLRIGPNQPGIWFNLGVAQSRLGQSTEALTAFDSMIALSPLSGAGHLQRAATLARLGRYDEAVAACDDAVRLLPNDPLTAIHRGLALQWRGHYDQALVEFDRAIALRPDFAEAWVCKAMLKLLLGDLRVGFALNEWRWRMSARHVSPRRRAADESRPLWLGKPDIAGKTLLIYLEQGLGDVIQFCRYATLAANAGARIIVEVQPALKTLMTTLPGVSQVITDQDRIPEHDFRCPMWSLPLAFGTTLETIPADIPYLRADPGRVSVWRDRLSGLGGRRIGLVWGAGSRLGDSELVALEQRKSVPLRTLAPLSAIEGCAFVSVQLGPAAAQSGVPHDRDDRARLHRISD